MIIIIIVDHPDHDNHYKYDDHNNVQATCLQRQPGVHCRLSCLPVVSCIIIIIGMIIIIIVMIIMIIMTIILMKLRRCPNLDMEDFRFCAISLNRLVGWLLFLSICGIYLFWCDDFDNHFDIMISIHDVTSSSSS